MSSSTWYVRLGDQVLGPISHDELRDRALQGSVTAQTQVSRDGTDWTEAATVPGIVFGVPTSPVSDPPDAREWYLRDCIAGPGCNEPVVNLPSAETGKCGQSEAIVNLTEVICAAPPPTAFEGEILLELEKLRKPQGSWIGALVTLAISLVLFIGLGMWGNPSVFIVSLISVLLIHELGHYVGMRVFGYQNARMFFIPFFGAAVSGQRTHTESYKDAIVALLGPLPGLFLAVILLTLAPYIDIRFRSHVISFSILLVWINGFNLLPIYPLDGGRFFSQILFSRNRYLELIFQLVATITMIFVAAQMDIKIFYILGVLVLLRIGPAFMMNDIAQRVARQLHSPLPPVTKPIPLPVFRTILAQVATCEKTANGLADKVFQVWEKLHISPPGIAVTVGLMFVYGLAALPVFYSWANSGSTVSPKLAADPCLAYCDRGRSCLEKGDNDKAIAEYTEAIRLDPKRAKAYNDRGVAYRNAGEYDKAISDCNEAARLDPQLADAFLIRGDAYRGKREYDKAIADYVVAIRLNPKSAVTYYSRGDAYAGKGECDKAIADYSEAIRFDPKNTEVFLIRGLAYAQKGDNDKAIADFTEAITLAPKLTPAYSNRGEEYLKAGENDKAIADCTEAIRLDPTLAIAYNNRGLAYFNKGENDKAITDWTEAIQLNPTCAMVYVSRGEAYREKHEYDAAIADCTKAIRLDPKSATAYMARGEAYAQKGDNDKAIADYNEAIQLNPKNALAYYSRGLAFGTKGVRDKAIADYTASIRLDPHAQAYCNRGLAYDCKGEHDKAIADCTEAIRLDPQFAWAYFYRGSAYGRKGEYDKAIADLTKAIELDPKNAKAFELRAIAYEQKGELGKAEDDHKRAKELGYKSE